MRVELTCKACEARFTLDAEPSRLDPLRCPSCGATAAGRASEDFASAVEDALAQLWQLGATFEVDLHVSTRHIPPAFVPAEKGRA